MAPSSQQDVTYRIAGSSTGKGILIGMLSAFGSAAIVAFILLLIWFFQYTQRGRILLDRLGRPGEYDDEQVGYLALAQRHNANLVDVRHLRKRKPRLLKRWMICSVWNTCAQKVGSIFVIDESAEELIILPA